MPDTDRLIGTTISHYRVLEKLGGGMGVVYRAQSPEHLHSSRRRGVQGTSLHCHEYLDGRPLNRVLDERPMATDELLGFGIQIADGVEAAQEHP